MLQNDNTKADTMLSDFEMIQLFDLESTMTCDLHIPFLSPSSGDAWDHACVACAAIRQENPGQNSEGSTYCCVGFKKLKAKKM